MKAQEALDDLAYVIAEIEASDLKDYKKINLKANLTAIRSYIFYTVGSRVADKVMGVD